MEFSTVLSVVMAVIIFILLRKKAVSDFKIAYYEQKLANRGVDIDHIKNVKSIRQISKL